MSEIFKVRSLRQKVLLLILSLGLEVLATLHTVEFNCDLGLSRIILEENFLQVINAVQAMGQNWNRYGYIIADICSILQGFRS